MDRPLFNLAAAADLLGLARQTLMAAIGRGLPVVQKADRDKRIPWQIDLGAAMDFLLQEAATKAAAELTGPRGELKSALMRKAAAEAIVAEIRAEERLKCVVPVAYVTERLGQELDRIRAELLQVGGRVSAKWRLGMTAPQVAELVSAEVRAATRNLTRRSNLTERKV